MQVEEKFGPYTALKNRIMSLVTQLIAIQEEKCMQYLDVVLQIETLPFTQNTFYYTSCRDKWLAKYKAAREQKESLSVAAKSGFPDPPRPGPDSSSNGGPFPLSLSSEPPLRRTLDEVSTTELPFTTASSVEAAAKLSVFGDSGTPATPATGSSTAASNPSAVPISQARSTIGSSGTLPGISQPAGPFASQAPDSIFATLKPSPSLPSKGLFGSSGTLHPTPGGTGLATPSTPRTLVSVPAKPNISWPSIGSSASISSGAPQTKPTPIGSSFFAVPPSSGTPASNPSNTNLPSPFAFSTPAPPKVNPSGTGPSILLSPAGSPAPDTTKPGSATPFGGLFSAQSSGAPQAKPSSTGSTLFPGLPGFASPTGSVTMKGGSTISYTGIFAVPHLVQPPPVQPHRVDISPFIGGFTKSGVCNFPEKSFEEMRVEALTARRPIKKAPNLKMKARATIPSAIVQSDASEQDYNDALSALAKIGITGLTKEDLGRLQPSDQYTRELNVMAQVRAYFGISYRRVIDNVPLIIDYMFVQALGKELQLFLISGLALGTADATLKCAAYLAEDPETRALREEVVARRRRLHDVALELRKIM
ncbi:hypothetical protein GLOTRDRAFT_133483 [Gloeophyllum trabeum ATCC 11539]|uniref:GED domain-containing protein n=1 Tax=Gloeophyllum trabeum (strain ATCC 11539 / FP-39264 / Madison 617) TaxID=670483 RepID=S7PTQ1_GLOTA|nr:uncharacterized protein GLOTRDRAFT_133483 [Gloeophyllum trabeum ATCC 11539]EPQ51166.1 hypothetical protein GLOTRDRAFT_133483 [Gloeophyllum trabeum ATCC 11539]